MLASLVRIGFVAICIASLGVVSADSFVHQAPASTTKPVLLSSASTNAGFQSIEVAPPSSNCRPALGSDFGLFRDPSPRRTWITMEYATLWNDGYRVPALVTTSDAGTPRDQAGVLGQPSTSNLVGNTTLSDDSMSGLSLQIGRWLDHCGNTAVVGSFYFGNNENQTSTYPGDANTIVSRPFFNVDPSVNAPDAELVNFPGAVSGSIVVGSESEFFSGSLGLQKCLQRCENRSCCSGRSIQFLLGYRTFWFDEDLSIAETLFPTGGLLAAGTRIDVEDLFSTQNRFHGFELGILWTWQRKRWQVELQNRTAIGNIYQRVTIDGSTITSVPGSSTATQPYGVLATSSNIGEYERDRFGYLLDSYVGLSYQVSHRMRLKLGYNMLFLSSVARPGRYVDTVVNGTLIDPNVANNGPARPSFRWADSESAWLHGLRLGAEYYF